MTAVSKSQMTFDFEPSLPERFVSLRAFVAFRVQEQRLNAAALAGKMDLSPSVLSRKLNQNDGDSQRFNTDDLEGYIKATGDVSSVMEYLAAKYMDSAEARKTRVINRMESILPELLAMLSSVKESA